MSIWKKFFLMGKLDAMTPSKLKPEIDSSLLVLPKDETLDKPAPKLKLRGCNCHGKKKKP
jgi:hypothetical protein